MNTMAQATTTTRTSTGAGAASTLKVALEGPGRRGRVSHMMEQICWRRETRLSLDGEDLGPAADQVEVSMVDQETPRLITTTITGLRVAGIAIPITSRSKRLAYRGAGVWTIGAHRIEIVQPGIERDTFH